MQAIPAMPVVPQVTAVAQAAPVAAAPAPGPSADTVVLEKLAKGYATFADYTNLRLTCSPAQAKSAVKDPTIKYTNIPLLYNVGSDEKKLLADLLFEYPVVKTERGIQSEIGKQSGKMEHSVMIRFDLSSDDQNKCLVALDQLYRGSAYIVNTYKGVAGLPFFNPAAPEASGYENPVYYARDQTTNEIVQGRAPSMFFKLFEYGKPGFVERTLFTGLDGKPIDWSLLRNVEMKFIPLVQFKAIFLGTKKKMQVELKSAIVTDIKACSSMSRQIDTLKQASSDPDQINTFQAQISKLENDRKAAEADRVSVNSAPPVNSDGQPSFSGILVASGPVGGPISGTTARQDTPPGYSVGAMPVVPNFAPGSTQVAQLPTLKLN
jgi:hypothetical protein